MHPHELVISDYVDGTLATAERIDVERHLENCAACRLLADDLGHVGDRARALPPVPPPAAAWGRIERAIRQHAAVLPATGRRRFSVSWRTVGWALAATLVLATVVGLRIARPHPPSPGGPAIAAGAPAEGASDARDLAQSVDSELRQAEEHYDNAIKGLDQIANSENGAIDPQIAATVQKHLTLIDQAISESRAALRTQPDSEPAQQSLLESFRTKLMLLEDTVALINEMRKGNEAGAARIVSGLQQKGT
jgi:anti-sigma factor RsiW